MRFLFKLLYLVIAPVAIILFYLWHKRNTVMVEVDYFSGSLSLPLSVCLFLAFVFGLLLGVVLLSPFILDLRVRLGLLRRRLAAAKPTVEPKSDIDRPS